MDEKYGLGYRFQEFDQIRRNWTGFLAIGILLIIIGSAAIGFSVFTTLFSIFILGAFLASAGILQIIQSFWARKWSGLFLSAALGILYLVTGVICFARPTSSAIALTLLIAAFCLISGLVKMFNAIVLRFSQWGWVFFNGLITFILGILILSDWPVSGLWVIGLFVGIDILLLGWTWVLLALSAKKSES
ncbi:MULTISPECIES: HdeD family acid-resistance protein [Parachlamydia]|jgi:uncharacterized membrane protein HdeD (DUF308 family)|uniref:HdeD protein n=2 Tax=Parachlamydia acanthamoebae TaxID=83552 RepID=F8L0C0_PARAV|nr:DUF308 domain-containing protein [Parachlamydia acanthamoebae]EFB41619.1 hypothetical protein pah_c026o052 [Parachlamydia acanthamoebae str. Hall's coccus]CCB86650.1 putative uncharacterized protein [Parachlamydia acanthamoebae UV-7]